MILDLLQYNLETVLFVFFRISGLFFIAPVFSQRGMPPHMKIMFALILAAMISPLVTLGGYTAPTNLLDLVALGLREVALGMLIGFVFASLFIGVQMAGAFIGFQMGFMIVNVIDPVTQDQVSIMSQFKYILATLMFFILNGHHMILQALVMSYKLVPLNEAVFRFAVTTELASIITGIFVIGIKIASPVMAALILTDVALGVISRTVPQMNIFIVGFPIKIALGLFFTGASVPIFALVFRKALGMINTESLKLISYLAR
ncbi:MAG: flagellar type III secretion system protein FliR [candidate division Zixibacteria bacterium]|nr:flagellar type III secretion system protein FliR [candidate division Zixibacteria bacterium]